MTKKSSMTLETIAIDELQAHPRNYRGHPAEQIAHLKASLAEYGIVKNIVVASDNVILAGHGLVQAAREAGYKELPVCRIAMPSSDPKAQKFMVLDNEVSRKSEDDGEQLAALLKELQDSQDLTGTGYDSDEVTQLLNDLQAEEFGAGLNEDAGPEEPPIEPVTRLGDIWVMGEHRLVCGDCTEVGVWDAVMQGEKAQAIITSPPYAQQRDYELSGFVWDDVVPEAIVLASTYATQNGSLLVNLGLVHSDGRVIEYWRPLFDAMYSCGRPLFGWYVWDKMDGLPGDWNGRLRPSHEWVFHFAVSPRRPQKTKECKHAGHVVTQAGMRGVDGSVGGWTGLGDNVGSHKEPDSVIRCTPAKGGVEGHPAPFSIGFAAELVEPFATEKEIVADCFMGSGTTLIACEQLNRICYGIELEPRYVDVAVKRWQKLTGKQAILESTGEAFSGE